MAVAGRVRRVAIVAIITCLLLGALGYLGRGGRGNARDVLARDGSGSWWFPRGGPYVLGFDAPGPATLTIDGEDFVSGQGVTSRRGVFEPGMHRVRFMAPAGARLFWNPPWRNGPLEEVLPSSLSPDEPALAELTSPGTDQSAAALAAGFLLVLLWFLLRLGRPFEDGRIWGPGLAVFIAAAVGRVAGLRAGGPIAGEDVLYSAGLNMVRGLLAGVPPGDAPPVTLYFAGVGALAQDGFLVARLIFAALGAGGCMLAFAAGSRLFGVRAGFFAGMFCALLPSLIGHGRTLGPETPAIFFATMAVWVAVAATQDDCERPGWLAVRLAAAGVALGLAAASRLDAAVLFPVVLVAGIVPARRPHVLRAVAITVLVVPLAALATLLTVWPAVALDPLARLASVAPAHPPTLRLGALVLATTPLVILVLAALAGGLRAAFMKERAWLVVVVWLAAPFTVALMPARPDSLRDVLPAVVPLCIAAGAGLDAVLAKVASVAFLLGLLVVSYLVVVCTSIHPYYLEFYGVQVGGAAAVAERGSFPIGARGEGLGRGVGTINGRAAPGAHVARVVEPRALTWFRADLWAGLTDDVRPDSEWILVNRPASRGFAPPPDAKLELEVGAEGAWLVRIYHREPPQK